MAPSSPSLLSEVSVLDLSIWRPGPYATSLLVGLGADVVKVEPPGGDPMRHYPELFESVNAGKRSIMLDLKEPDGAGRRRALELAAEADVIVEGFRPGVMARLGLGEAAVRALNSGVVYCSISGYGQQGPLAVAPGHDLNYQAWAGALAPDGGAAVMPPLPLADLASGMTAAFGICAALLGRGAGGPGTYLDISMTDVMATWTGSASSVSDEDPVGCRCGGGAGAGGGAGDRGRGRGSCLWIPRRAGLRALRYRRRPAGGARRRQRAALLVCAVHRAGTRRPGWPHLQRTPGSEARSWLGPSPTPSGHATATTWCRVSWRPASRPPRCSTAPACSPLLPSRASPSGSVGPLDRRRRRLPPSTNTGARGFAGFARGSRVVSQRSHSRVPRSACVPAGVADSTVSPTEASRPSPVWSSLKSPDRPAQRDPSPGTIDPCPSLVNTSPAPHNG